MNEYFVTSESVTEGHPDKICDQISDGILDAYLRQDENSRVAIETMVSKDAIMIAGEVNSKGKVDIANEARKIVKNIGYDRKELGFDYKSCIILTNITAQSKDISVGVDKCKGELGAGDQGIMYGYACDDTENFMPLTQDLANKITMRLAEARKNGEIPWIRPDGKSQVTMKYDEGGKPISITSIVVSTQHEPNIDYDYMREVIKYEIIDKALDSDLLKYDTKIHINPTGSFVLGGPAADTGLTGRKIMVDTYGGIGKHGGGAFSGKDASKVDRSAAYMARYAAKNVVAAKLAGKIEIAVNYVIGSSAPEEIVVNTFGTENINIEYISKIIKDTFSFSVSDIIDELHLREPQFLKTAAYGHFGRENQNFRWEKVDKVDELKSKAVKYIEESFK